jgi:hypothetical protein
MLLTLMFELYTLSPCVDYVLVETFSEILAEYYFRPGSVPTRYWEWRSRNGRGPLTSSSTHGEPVGVVSYEGLFSQDELLKLEVPLCQLRWLLRSHCYHTNSTITNDCPCLPLCSKTHAHYISSPVKVRLIAALTTRRALHVPSSQLLLLM